MEKKINGLNKSNIFLWDAAGALISIICLIFIYKFEGNFGMPKSIVKNFIFIASILLLSSTFLHFKKSKNWPLYLKTITFLNTIYCFYTVIEIILNASTLRLLGYVYFILEIVVILILVKLEFSISNEKQ